MPDVLARLSSALADRYGLRGYDAVQLAAAVAAQARLSRISNSRLIFVSADNDLNNAALAEGLAVENPNDH